MAEYLYLFKGGNEQQLSPEQMQKHMQAWFAWIGELQKRGVYQAGHPLERTGKTLRGKRKTVTDGPLAEAKEHFGGYLILECETPERAVDVAARFPSSRFHPLEVRPIMEPSGEEM